VVVDDRIYLSHGSGSLTCLELASGKMLWTQTVAAAAVPADPQGRPAGWASAPVADGKQVAFATFDGQLAAYDRDGKQLWSKPTGLKGSQVRQFEGVLVVQGTADASWGPLMDRSELPTNLKRAPTGVVMFKATDGSEIGRYSSNRKNEEGQFIQPRGSDKVYYVMNAFVLLDLADAKPALAIDTFCPLEQAVSVSTDTIYLSSLGWRTAILVYVQPDGRLAWRHTWESSTDHKGYTDAPALVHKGMLWSWSHVVDHGPHCPDRRSALYVDDAGTGYPIVRVKPVLQHTVGSYQTPVVAGDYVCFLAGGGHPYGASDFSRMSMVSADGQFFVAQPGMELDIRSVKPVFAGDRLLVRSATSLTCVRVNGDEGRKFQAQQLATAVLRYIGPEPMGGKVLSIEPAQDLKPSPDVPVGLVQSYPTQYWLGAGPFPPGDEPSPQLAQLRGRIGTEVTLNGKTLKLAPLSTQHAANAPPLYLRQAELQGTGDTMPVFDAFLDPRVYSGKEASGVFYTVLDNTIERVVKPAWYEERMRGISVWVNGQMIPKDQAMHLRPGLYPVVIRIDPAFYDREVRLDEMPIDVAKALEAKAADAINWPTTWHVVGPLPGDVKSLPAEQLASMPGATMKIEDDEFEVHQIPTRDSLLLLTGLLTHTKGTKSDWSKAPVEIEIAAPFLALCYAQIDVPEDGSLYVNASADWYMRWYVDGNMVCDTMATGNKGPARLVTAQAFEVPLKKGKHVVCVQVKPGSKGWLVTSQAAFSSKPKADLKAFELVRGPKEGFDFRFRPCFSEVPSPAAIQQRYQQRLSYCEPRLAAIVRDLPDSVEARGAQALLEKLRQSKASQP
jgi:outer membrane protein assembly factor BamB